MSDVIITTVEDIVTLHAPYHPKLPAGARAIGGRFDWDSRVWRFNIKRLTDVEQLAATLYGYSPNPSGTTCTVHVTLGPGDGGAREIRFAGRQIAYRHERDYKVFLGENVTIISGEFERSGGSRNHPAIGRTGNIVLEIRDLPIEALAVETDLDYEIVHTETEQ